MATLLGYAWIVVLKRQALELSWILVWHHVSPLYPLCGLELRAGSASPEAGCPWPAAPGMKLGGLSIAPCAAAAGRPVESVAEAQGLTGGVAGGEIETTRLGSITYYCIHDSSHFFTISMT